MCLGEMTTQNDENCLRKLFSAIGKVWTAKEKYFFHETLRLLTLIPIQKISCISTTN
jgi:hypothetical protein